MDKDYEYFEKWYAENERRFHCGQMDERQIAYSAFLEGQKQSRQAAVSGSLPLVEALEQYIGVLVDELNEVAGMAAIHGWKSSRVEIGEQLRNRITELKRQ